MPVGNNLSSILTVYTIGHSNVSDTVIISMLQKYRIRVLVDVRSSPYSQYNPQFNREVFRKTLMADHINYRYAGAYLGGRPKDPTCYKDKRLPDVHSDYLHLVDYPALMQQESFIKGIDCLIELATQSSIALMCSEEDPQKCHRHHLIGVYLTRQRGVKVMHIRGDGTLVSDQQLKEISVKPETMQPALF